MRDKRRLGRGLEALLSEGIAGPDLVMLRLDSIDPNPRQPRTHPEDDIDALADSVAEMGVLQPILVRQKQDGGYELLAGERRLRAAKKAGLEKIPAVVLDADEAKTLAIALVENLQRENLNPVEEARAFLTLQEDFGMTHEEIGDLVGLDRATVSNRIRLLGLAEPVLEMMEQGRLSEGHARLLLRVEDPEEQRRLAEVIVKNGLSVRGAERLVSSPKPRKRRVSPEEKAYEESFLRNTGLVAKVKIGKRKVKLSIEFSSKAQLEEFMARMEEEI